MSRRTKPPAPRHAGPAILLCLTGIALAAPAFVAPARAAVETGRPYLKRPALSPAALARQVEGDRQLTARYAKHFNAAPGAIGRAFREARPITLPPGRYTVWLTGRDGLRYPTMQDRDRETRAFLVALPFERDPQAWLEAGTGNPMQVFRPVEEVEVVIETPPAMVTEQQSPEEVLVPVQPVQPSGDASAAQPTPAPAATSRRAD